MVAKLSRSSAWKNPPNNTETSTPTTNTFSIRPLLRQFAFDTLTVRTDHHVLPVQRILVFDHSVTPSLPALPVGAPVLVAQAGALSFVAKARRPRRQAALTFVELPRRRLLQVVLPGVIVGVHGGTDGVGVGFGAMPEFLLGVGVDFWGLEVSTSWKEDVSGRDKEYEGHIV